MDLRTAILSENSKTNIVRLSSWAGRDRVRIGELVQLFLSEDYKVVQRAAWILSEVAMQAEEEIRPYIGALLGRCRDSGIPVAVKRNVTRILQRIAIPEEHHAAAMNLCFELLADPRETVAVRCFSMGILAGLCSPYPELKQELRSLIESALEQEELTPAFRNKSGKVLRQLKSPGE